MRSARSSGTRTIVFAVVASVGLLGLTARADAQPIPINQFAPTNIDIAVARTILQTVSQLPPVTNVGLSYQYDPQLDTFVARKGSLGSGMVPAARFARKGSITGTMSAGKPRAVPPSLMQRTSRSFSRVVLPEPGSPRMMMPLFRSFSSAAS